VAKAVKELEDKARRTREAEVKRLAAEVEKSLAGSKPDAGQLLKKLLAACQRPTIEIAAEVAAAEAAAPPPPPPPDEDRDDADPDKKPSGHQFRKARREREEREAQEAIDAGTALKCPAYEGPHMAHLFAVEVLVQELRAIYEEPLAPSERRRAKADLVGKIGLIQCKAELELKVQKALSDARQAQDELVASRQALEQERKKLRAV